MLRILDQVDHTLCEMGVMNHATFEDVLQRQHRALYAGRLSRDLPQYYTHMGLTPYFPSSRNISFDVTKSMPLPDDSIDLYQAEDVFEHIEYDHLPSIFDEIHRVLKPGGTFRFSVPDYRFDYYRDRSLKDENGAIIFDPGGGGRFDKGRVLNGGHLWFPTYELVAESFARSKFGQAGSINFMHYTEKDGSYVMNPIDHSIGSIQRVPEHDARVSSRPRPVSIVLDAVKKQID